VEPRQSNRKMGLIEKCAWASQKTPAGMLKNKKLKQKGQWEFVVFLKKSNTRSGRR
jgi:hypothetical protein